MSEENVEIFKRGVELWNRDDFDTWIELHDPEVEWFALMEVYRGRAGVREAWESFKGDMQITVRFGDLREPRGVRARPRGDGEHGTHNRVELHR